MQAPAETIAKYEALPRKAFRRTYAAMVDEMDQAIGKILDTLDKEGITNDTQELGRGLQVRGALR